MSINRLVRRTLACALLCFLGASVVRVAVACEPVVGKLVTVEGQVEIQRASGPAWTRASLDEVLCQGDLVRAGQRSRATVQLINQAVLRIDQNTAMRLDNITGKTEERSTLSLLKGAFQSFSRKPRGFEVNTPYLNGSIEGTEFVFRVKENESELTVFEGIVVASNNQGSVSVSGGESVAAAQGQAPQVRTVVRPRDAAQWSLYYPPVMAAPAQGAGAAQAILQNAAELLSVGRVDEARAEIDKALGEDPNAGLAYALRAVFHVVQNNNDQALVDANHAVSLSPDSAAAKIALSYAQQAAFELPGARDTLQQAVQQQPDDALAWARLSELHLMLGERRQARESAQQAATLDPNLSRTQITLGFAALAEFRNADAKAAFERAIELDAADPLPHLGLGLAKISVGDLEAGRSDIEVAVGLGSNDALLRAYLGKAYFEERRTPLDTDQFDIAKQLDPNDPTAWLYSGIAKQSMNRPVEALQDMEASIERNDNRAAFRSRLLLDQDRAARGTSLARVHNDLGFLQLGKNESAKSLAVDPANASAHRFLSDSYQNVRRREISRVSEMLQAQMLQDVNINPVQPSLSVTNLNTFTRGGPAEVGFNEFTPLFEQNSTKVDVSGVVGNNGTRGAEGVVTALYDQFSFSAGAYTYDTDGWRRNNDLKEKIINVYSQWAVTPKFNVQAEYRRQDTDEGDLEFAFDPDDVDNTKEIDRNQDMARLGLRFSPTTASDMLFSYIYSDIDFKQTQSDNLGGPVIDLDDEPSDDGHQVEGQYLFRHDWFNVVAGVAYSEVDLKVKDSFVVTLPPIEVPFPPGFIQPPPIKGGTNKQSQIDHKRGYFYNNISTWDSVAWTLGVSYDDYEEENLDWNTINPKFGVKWDVTDTFSVRAAAFKTLKPALLTNRTLEPTQVAGFNQFFDDVNATKSRRYGGGLDWRPVEQLWIGAEASFRDIDEPVLNGDHFVTENRDERLHRTYAYWTPTKKLAFTAEVVYDRYNSEKGLPNKFGSLPEKVRTVSVPVGVRYFMPNGFFAGLGGSYVDQEVRRSDTSTRSDGKDSFYLVDAAVGYRLPKRRGVLSLSVQNMFDNNFEYQDDSFREFSTAPSTGPYFTDRTVLGQVTLSF